MSRDIEVEEFSDVVSNLKLTKDNAPVFKELYRATVPMETKVYQRKDGSKITQLHTKIIYTAIAEDDSIYILYTEIIPQTVGKEDDEEYQKRVAGTTAAYELRIQELSLPVEIVKGYVKRGVSK